MPFFFRSLKISSGVPSAFLYFPPFSSNRETEEASKPFMNPSASESFSLPLFVSYILHEEKIAPNAKIEIIEIIKVFPFI